MARPKLELNEENIEKLAMIQCSKIEIAAFMGCSVDTLDNRFSEVIAKGREAGKTSLRRKQYETAMNGNVTMLIWLGKQWLGHTDKIEQKTEMTTTDTADDARKELERLKLEISEKV